MAYHFLVLQAERVEAKLSLLFYFTRQWQVRDLKYVWLLFGYVSCLQQISVKANQVIHTAKWHLTD